MSLNALPRGGTESPPTWSELSSKLVGQLCSNDPMRQEQMLRETGAVSGFLRLAEKFEARYGRSALNDFLTDAVGDRRQVPGPMHDVLVRLPWTDIFTTNWDTLIERAADRQSRRRYERVFSPDDLPITSRPRIIKLHGTMPNNKPYVFTEEDFRTYPQRFGPFVNTVQQAMMETVFVLIGFSGDDPNFLKWSGWVRDRLQSASPKIFMVNDFSRTEDNLDIMRALNIVPVDLSRMPESWKDPVRDIYQEGLPLQLGAWLHRLAQPKRALPRNWPGNIQTQAEHRPPEPAVPPVDGLRAFAASLRTLRQEYPKWIIAPADSRDELREDRGLALDSLQEADRRLGRGDADDFSWHLDAGWLAKALDALYSERKPAPEAIAELDDSFRHDPNALLAVAQAYYEILWRRRIDLSPWPFMAVDILSRLVLEDRTVEGPADAPRWPESSLLVRQSQDRRAATALTLDLADLLLAAMRETAGDSKRFRRLADGLERHHTAACDYTRLNRLLYERALFAMDRGDLAEIRRLLDRWDARSTDPICAFRRADLLGYVDTSADRDDSRKDRWRSLEEAFLTCRTNLSYEEKSFDLLSRESWLLTYFERLKEGQVPSAQSGADAPDETGPPDRRKSGAPDFLAENFEDRLDELAAVRCDPRRELRRIGRNVSDPETLRQGAVLLDTIGWQVFSARLRDWDAQPSGPDLDYPVASFGLRYIRAALTAAQRAYASVASARKPSRIQEIDRHVSDAIAMLLRCRLGPAERRAQGLGWSEVARQLPSIGARLARLSKSEQQALRTSRTLSLCFDALAASVGLLAQTNHRLYNDAPKRYYHAVAILGALTEDIPLYPAEQEPGALHMHWPGAFIDEALDCVCNAMNAYLDHEPRLRRWSKDIGPVLERLCELVQQQIMVQPSADKAALIERMLTAFWKVKHSRTAPFVDPLSLVQKVSHDDLSDKKEAANTCACLTSVLARPDDALNAATRLRLIRLFDAARDLGFQIATDERERMAGIIAATLENAPDGLAPWEWMLLPEAADARERFTEKVFEQWIATADPDTGLIDDADTTRDRLDNIAWAMRHDRVNYRPPTPVHITRLVAWLTRLADGGGAQLSAPMKDDMSEIFLGGLAREGMVAEIEDHQLCIRALVAFRKAGILVEPAIPAFARLLSATESGVSPHSLGALLRAGLAARDGPRFTAAFEATLEWLRDSNNDARRKSKGTGKKTDKGKKRAPVAGRSTLPLPPSLMGAFSQVLASSEETRMDTVLGALREYVELHDDVPSEFLMDLLTNLQDRIDLSIAESLGEHLVMPLEALQTALSRVRADRHSDEILKEITKAVEHQIGAFIATRREAAQE
ncbi:SIR2 family protein [Salipiger sp. P9]|uniref:SIR2 family NAD-dependent protein deacylase n=1 Tax=Salipiger pentaromativorans TaxID=2943193 RepID=UPI00215752A3|nr:SIR2 family protein [Salipiger pentaromativorans]MCR8547432.1 SIR2 family protein [Salipiger pentaromativorans]